MTCSHTSPGCEDALKCAEEVSTQVGRLTPRSLLVRTSDYVQDLRELTQNSEPEAQEQVKPQRRQFRVWCPTALRCE